MVRQRRENDHHGAAAGGAAVSKEEERRRGRKRSRPWGLVLLAAALVGAAAYAPSPATAFVCRPSPPRPLTPRFAAGASWAHQRLSVRQQGRPSSWPRHLAAAAAATTSTASTGGGGGSSNGAEATAGAPAAPAAAPATSHTVTPRQFVTSVAVGLLGAGVLGTLILPQGTPVGPLAWTLLPFLLCLTGGLPQAGVGSWKSLTANLHRFGGIGTLTLPLILVVREALTSQHAPAPLYYLTVAAVATNLLFGLALIPSRFPAYDVPAARGLAVGSLHGMAFLGWSLTFRIGAHAWYAPLGKIFSLIALYGVVFSWSDALQNLWCWARGKYKKELGRKWFLPFDPSSYRQVFFQNLYRQPTREGLQASLMTVWHGALPTFFVALFGSVALLQLTYLRWGPASVAHLASLHPHFARWAAYQSLLAVGVNQFAVFLVTLVVHNRMTLGQVAFFNAMVPLAPLLNILAFCLRYPGASFPGMVRAILENPAVGTSVGASAAAGAAAGAGAGAGSAAAATVMQSALVAAVP